MPPPSCPATPCVHAPAPLFGRFVAHVAPRSPRPPSSPQHGTGGVGPFGLYSRFLPREPGTDYRNYNSRGQLLHPQVGISYEDAQARLTKAARGRQGRRQAAKKRAAALEAKERAKQQQAQKEEEARMKLQAGARGRQSRKDVMARRQALAREKAKLRPAWVEVLLEPALDETVYPARAAIGVKLDIEEGELLDPELAEEVMRDTLLAMQTRAPRPLPEAPPNPFKRYRTERRRLAPSLDHPFDGVQIQLQPYSGPGGHGALVGIEMQVQAVYEEVEVELDAWETDEAIDEERRAQEAAAEAARLAAEAIARAEGEERARLEAAAQWRRKVGSAVMIPAGGPAACPAFGRSLPPLPACLPPGGLPPPPACSHTHTRTHAHTSLSLSFLPRRRRRGGASWRRFGSKRSGWHASSRRRWSGARSATRRCSRCRPQCARCSWRA